MTGRRTWIAFCVALLALAPPLCAEGRYRVSVKVLPGDDVAVLASQLAGTYGGRLESMSDAGEFVIAMTEARGQMLSADAHVLSIEPIGSLPIGPYGYDGSGNIKSIGADTYKYDSAGRITSGTAAGHKQEYSYDAFGNLLTITTDGRTDTRINLRVDAETNRAALRSGESATPEFNAWGEYDAAGNMKSFGGSSSFTYDGAGMVTGTIIDQRRKVYLYTADDERVASITVVPNGTSWAEGESEWTLRGPDQKVLRRFRKSQAGDWTWDEDYIYRRGLLLAAEANRPEKTLRFHPDHLGTPRLITGNGGAEVSRHAYYSFGFEALGSASPSPSPERLKFTGHERDEVNVDYMHARYYQAGWGRFLSVDPTWQSADIGRPQSWNRYAYVLNDPISNTDPDGRCGVPEACPEPPSRPDPLENIESLLPSLPIVIDPKGRPLETLANVVMIAALATPFSGDDRVGAAAVNTARRLSTEEATAAAQRAYRSAAVEANSGPRSQRPATMVGATRAATGETVVGRSKPGKTGCCAETDAAGKLATNAAQRAEIVFSTPTRPRTGQKVDVCADCQRKFNRSQFPSDTGFEPK